MSKGRSFALSPLLLESHLFIKELVENLWEKSKYQSCITWEKKKEEIDEKVGTVNKSK